MIQTMAGAPQHGARTYRANGTRGPGAFTRGDRGSWGETAAGLVPRATVGLAERHVITAARRPWRELPDPEVKIIRAARIACPGCGIVPPRSRPCDTCARS